MSQKIIIAALVTWLMSISSEPTSAGDGKFIDLRVCNNFAHTVYFAVAYQQQSGDWMTRGWMQVETGTCGTFDTDLRMREFYSRGQTDWYRVGAGTRKTFWGGGKDDSQSFDVDGDIHRTFNFWQADKPFPGVTALSFYRFLGDTTYSSDSDSVVTVTYNADGTSTSSVKPLH